MSSRGTWLSILDYAKLKKVSISTIRRHIKSNKVQYKSIEGKYFIFVDQNDQTMALHTEELKNKLEIELLKERIRKLEEENNDLKMLVDIYEGKQLSFSNKTDQPPSIPMS